MTPKQMIIEYMKSNEIFTSNYADYTSFKDISEKIGKDLVTCGWMDMHDDLQGGASFEEPLFSIIPYWIDPSARLVVTVDGRFSVVKPTVNKKITFDATQLHCLVPERIALTLHHKTTPSEEYAQWWNQIQDKPIANKPRIVWEFTTEEFN